MLAFVRDKGRVTVADVMARFQLTEEAATKHVDRAYRAQLLEPDRAGYIKAVRWSLTDRARRRLYYRVDGGARAGTIEFV